MTDETTGDVTSGSSTLPEPDGARGVATRWVALGVLAVALLLAGVVSFYAASSPDGLNKVAIDQGFIGTETQHHAADGPFAGYASSFISDGRLSGGVAGVVGVVVVLALAGGLALVLRRRRPQEPDAA